MQYFGLGGIGVPAIFASGIVLLIAWSFFWKGFALWHAARRGHYWWFIIFLVINTFGILEIVYIFFVAKVPEFRKAVWLDRK